MERPWLRGATLLPLALLAACTSAAPEATPTPTLVQMSGSATVTSASAPSASAPSASAPSTAPATGSSSAPMAPTGSGAELMESFFAELETAMATLSGAQLDVQLLGSSEATCTVSVTYEASYTDDFLADCKMRGTVPITLLQVDGERYVQAENDLLAGMAPGIAGSDARWLALGEVDYDAGSGPHSMFNQIDSIADGTWAAMMRGWVTTGSVEVGDKGVRSYVFGIDADGLVSDVRSAIGEQDAAGGSGSQVYFDVVTDIEGRLLFMGMREQLADETAKSAQAGFSYEEPVAELSPPDPATVHRVTG